MLGFDAREHLAALALQNVKLLVVVHFLELVAGEAGLRDVGIVRDNVELLGDRDGCLFRVACDHNHVNACRLARLNRRLALMAHRILDADVANERKSAF